MVENCHRDGNPRANGLQTGLPGECRGKRGAASLYGDLRLQGANTHAPIDDDGASPGGNTLTEFRSNSRHSGILSTGAEHAKAQAGKVEPIQTYWHDSTLRPCYKVVTPHEDLCNGQPPSSLSLVVRPPEPDAGDSEASRRKELRPRHRRRRVRSCKTTPGLTFCWSGRVTAYFFGYSGATHLSTRRSAGALGNKK